MPSGQVHLLLELLEAKRTATFRLSFTDGDVYELTDFAIHQDLGEEAETSATIVKRIAAPASKAKFTGQGKCIQFALKDVKEVAHAAKPRRIMWRAT